MYPELSEICHENGYALAVHGSLQRDFDLVAIPWVENPSLPNDVIERIVKVFAVNTIGEPETRLHGRLVYSISVGWGDCFFDFSFMPVSTPSNIASSGHAPEGAQ